MATEPLNVVHIPEILPPDQMVRFGEALATMTKLHLDLEPIYSEARQLLEIKSWTPEQRVRAGQLTAEYKNAVKEAENTIKPFKDAVNRFKEENILSPEKRVNNRAEEIRAVLSPRMAEWDREDERQKEAERQRIANEKQAELDRAAEVQRQADEAHAKELRAKRVQEIRNDLKSGKYGDPKTLKAKREAQRQLTLAGAIEEAARAKASADEVQAKEDSARVASTVKVGSAVGPVAGNVKRVNYSAVCTGPRNYVVAMMTLYNKKDIQGFERMLKMVEVSNQKLSGEAREHIKTSPDDKKHDLSVAQFEAMYPFVTVKEDRSF